MAALERAEDPEAARPGRGDGVHRVLGELLLPSDPEPGERVGGDADDLAVDHATDLRLPSGFPSNHQSNTSPRIAPSPQASRSRPR